MAGRILASGFGILKGLAGAVVGTLLFAALLVLIGLVLGPIRFFFDWFLP